MATVYSLAKNGATKLSTNFKVSEFACNDYSDYILIDSALVTLLQKIRDYFGKPVNITSGYRNLAYNTKVGSSSTSQHVKGTATDIQIAGVAPRLVAEYAEKLIPNTGGVGLYEYNGEYKEGGGSFTHVDVRAVRARWVQYSAKGSEQWTAGFYSAHPTHGDYMQQVQKRFSFDDNTMAFLDGYKWREALLERMATTD